MLEAIGVSSIDELFEVIPEAVRLGRPLELPDGKPETEVYDRLAGSRRAERPRRGGDQLPGRRDVRPLRPGDRRRDHEPLGVPDALHAVPARDLAGRTAGDVRVPDRDVGAHRPARLERRALRGPVGRRLRRLPGDRRHGAQEAGRLARRPPAQPRVAAHLRRGVWHRAGGGPPRRRRHRRRRPVRCDRRRDRRRLPAAAELPGRRRGRRGARRRGEGARRAGGGRLRPDRALDPQATRRVRRGHRRGGGAAARQPARLRRALLRLLLRDGGAHPPHAGPDRRRDHRRRRPPRLRPHAPDPRAAHPPREGDPQHLHGAGAQRARRHGAPRLAGQARLRRARRAAGPAHRLRAGAPRHGRRGRAAARGAGGPGVRGAAWTRPSPRCSTAAPRRGSAPAIRWAATTPSTRTGCWSRSPSGAAGRTSTGWPTCSAEPWRTCAAPRSREGVAS